MSKQRRFLLFLLKVAGGLAVTTLILWGLTAVLATNSDQRPTATPVPKATSTKPAPSPEVRRNPTPQEASAFDELIEGCKVFHAGLIEAKERGLTHEQMVEVLVASGMTPQQVKETAEVCAVVLNP